MALTINEYLARPMPEQHWIVDQLLPVGGALYLHGMPKVGKSLFGLGLAHAIAGNVSHFLDFPVRQHGRVLYVQVDMSPSLWREYVVGVLESGRDLDDLYLLDRLELPDYGLNLLKTKDMEWLKAQVEMVQPEVVILDTLRSLHAGDENDNTVMSNLYQRILSIIGPRALVLIHHSRKPGLLQDLIADARGATSIAAKVDVIAQLVRHGKKQFKLHYATRTRATYPDGLTLTQDKSTGLFHATLSNTQILTAIKRDNPEATSQELMDKLLDAGVKKSTAYRLIKGEEQEED